jgi:hypothetical protein
LPVDPLLQVQGLAELESSTDRAPSFASGNRIVTRKIRQISESKLGVLALLMTVTILPSGSDKEFDLEWVRIT